MKREKSYAVAMGCFHIGKDRKDLCTLHLCEDRKELRAVVDCLHLNEEKHQLQAVDVDCLLY
jgi:hypothetical protein